MSRVGAAKLILSVIFVASPLGKLYNAYTNGPIALVYGRLSCLVFAAWELVAVSGLWLRGCQRIGLTLMVGFMGGATHSITMGIQKGADGGASLLQPLFIGCIPQAMVFGLTPFLNLSNTAEPCSCPGMGRDKRAAHVEAKMSPWHAAWCYSFCFVGGVLMRALLGQEHDGN